jgi:hypothetical protein
MIEEPCESDNTLAGSERSRSKYTDTPCPWFVENVLDLRYEGTVIGEGRSTRFAAHLWLET